MGFWGVLWELARAVVPHAAPHVARVVVDAAKERRAANASSRQTSAAQPTNESLADAIAYLEQRLTVAEEKSTEWENKFLDAEKQMAERWQSARKVVSALIIWNACVSAALIALIVYMMVRR